MGSSAHITRLLVIRRLPSFPVLAVPVRLSFASMAAWRRARAAFHNSVPVTARTARAKPQRTVAQRFTASIQQSAEIWLVVTH